MSNNQKGGVQLDTTDWDFDPAPYNPPANDTEAWLQYRDDVTENDGLPDDPLADGFDNYPKSLDFMPLLKLLVDSEDEDPDESEMESLNFTSYDPEYFMDNSYNA